MGCGVALGMWAGGCAGILDNPQKWGLRAGGRWFGAALIWWILPWGFALLNNERQFLYDYLAGTRLVDMKKPQKPVDVD